MLANILLGILILLAIALLILVVLQLKTRQNVQQMWRLCQTQATSTQQCFTEEMVAELPTAVQRYFLHAIAPGTTLATVNTLEMRGKFRLGRQQPWLPMSCKEIITPRGFVWQADMGQGFLRLKGADYYVNALGRVQFALWGLIPVANVNDVDTARSSIGRLVQELVWLPSALLPQNGVKWREISENTIEAYVKLDDEPITLTLVIDGQGRVLEISSPRWGNHTNDGSWAYIPFGGTSPAENTFGGFTIPAQINIGWWFGTERYFDFFQCTIENAQFQS